METREERKEAWTERINIQYQSYKYRTLRGLVSLYYDNQEMRLAFENRLRILKTVAKLPEETVKITTLALESYKQTEDDLAKSMAKELKAIPVYTEYLSKIKGIGPVYSACLIAWIDGARLYCSECNARINLAKGVCESCEKKIKKFEDVRMEGQSIARFETVSKLLRYAGLSAIDGKVQRRRIGASIDFNMKLKTLMFKIGTGLMMSKNPEYRKLYDQFHEEYAKRGDYSAANPSGNKNKKHLQFRSMKKMERIFLSNLWVKWRQLEGLPVSEPYAFAVLHHSKEHLITPEEMVPTSNEGGRN